MKIKVKKICLFERQDDTFICPRCRYTEKRRVLGNVSSSPCPNCGAHPMYRKGTEPNY